MYGRLSLTLSSVVLMNRFVHNLRAALVPIAYGAIVIGGGLTGYLKAQSLISLIMGLAFGIPIIAAGFTIMRGYLSGFYTSAALIGVLTLFFHYKFVTTQTFMPSGMMAVISILTLLAMFFWRPKPKR